MQTDLKIRGCFDYIMCLGCTKMYRRCNGELYIYYRLQLKNRKEKYMRIFIATDS